MNTNNINEIGEKMYDLVKDLFPICRSITGDGIRETLKRIQEHIPIKIHEVPTGTQVFDWKVPKEWNIKDAYIKNSKGEKIVDFKKSNLHILNYSIPFRGNIGLKELKKHLFTLPEYPDLIPYLTSYYNENWGFCLPHKQYQDLKEDDYEVLIDSSLKDGYLTLGELYLKGKSEEEFLLSCYICHPSLCNDNLSGVVLLTFLAKTMLNMDLNYSYRFLFIPETIGAVAWLSLNENNINKIKYGLILTCVGDQGKFTYKKSRQGDAVIDRAVEKALADSGEPFKIIDFFPPGSDERQFSSPAFNLPVGSLMRTPYYGKFFQYHTSADNLDFVKPECLGDSFKKYLEVIFIIDNNKKYLNLNPKCEPQLGRRGIYRAVGGNKKQDCEALSMLSVLNLSDGKNSLLDIAIRAKINFKEVKKISDILLEAGLLKEI